MRRGGDVPNRDDAVGPAQAVRRFERRAASIANRLERQLEAAASFHNLSRRQLQASHRSVEQLSRGGAVPTASEFWEQTARPQARNLFEAATAAIDSEAAELTRALQQFATAIRLELRAGGGRLEPDWLIDDLHEVAERGVRQVVVTVRSLDQMDELGRWWQGRLRRKAMLSVMSKALTSPLRQFELIVSAAEMQLLEHPPWSHDDRLLSAFELTHSELREYAMHLERRMRRQAHSMLEAVAREDLVDRHRRRPTRPEEGEAGIDGSDRVLGASTEPAGPEAGAAEPSSTIELR
jgi:hypothetical protein